MSEYSDELRRLMLVTAAASIRYGLQHQQPMRLALGEFPLALQQPRACFVTLHQQAQLRGCIGSLQAIQPLIIDLVHNAYAAAFSDPRFAPISTTEYPELELHISILSEPETMVISDEADLLSQLRPGIDGLILEEGSYRATFLPSVWEQLPTARAFVAQLKRKAGLDSGYWSESIRALRYTTESFAALISELD
ncbi:MAG: AmmeMemoRadiSam system protein A [Gammaproteobacteria bacterium]|nr:AmmeMemoRadiSam system protein A [Gammaproteobacteria bacterium]